MQTVIWGARGSLPSSVNEGAIRSKIRDALRRAVVQGLSDEQDIDSFIDGQLPFHVRGAYGCNTSCVEIRDGNNSLVCDAGTGLREFGMGFMGRCGPDPPPVHVLLSHPHWDHVQGFPFFIPAYVPGHRIRVYGCHPDLASVFGEQQAAPCFPVHFEHLRADIAFAQLNPGQPTEIAGFRVTPQAQNHPGISYGYRIESNGKTIVYATDSEYTGGEETESSAVVAFFRNADLVIFDAQYTLSDAIYTKESWGHSSNMIGVELAVQAKAKHLCLFHYDPTASDQDLDQLCENTRQYAKICAEGHPLQISVAYEGLTIEV